MQYLGWPREASPIESPEALEVFRRRIAGQTGGRWCVRAPREFRGTYSE